MVIATMEPHEPKVTSEVNRIQDDRKAVEAGMVSVVIPSFGQLECTRICLPRLVKFCRKVGQMVFVDLASLDGTKEFQEGVAVGVPFPVEVVRLENEMPLAAACWEGIQRARGEYVVLISNDTLVPEGWLNHLVALAKLRPEIGMVGTMSNLAPPPQWVGKLPYRIRTKVKGDNGALASADLDAFDRFAREWRMNNMGQSFETERLGGSCLLLKTDVSQKVNLGGMPGPMGSMDGDLLSQLVIQAGYRLACCRDLFLHHLGSRMFAPLRIDQSTKMP